MSKYTVNIGIGAHERTLSVEAKQFYVSDGVLYVCAGNGGLEPVFACQLNSLNYIKKTED